MHVVLSISETRDATSAVTSSYACSRPHSVHMTLPLRAVQREPRKRTAEGMGRTSGPLPEGPVLSDSHGTSKIAHYSGGVKDKEGPCKGECPEEGGKKKQWASGRTLTRLNELLSGHAKNASSRALKTIAKCVKTPEKFCCICQSFSAFVVLSVSSSLCRKLKQFPLHPFLEKP